VKEEAVSKCKFWLSLIRFVKIARYNTLIFGAKGVSWVYYRALILKTAQWLVNFETP